MLMCSLTIESPWQTAVSLLVIFYWWKTFCVPAGPTKESQCNQPNLAKEAWCIEENCPPALMWQMNCCYGLIWLCAMSVSAMHHHLRSRDILCPISHWVFMGGGSYCDPCWSILLMGTGGKATVCPTGGGVGQPLSTHSSPWTPPHPHPPQPVGSAIQIACK